ncbi:MdtA/MuxA family multidrug efflux RND transporter periplasmic adaptor subunit [Pigmentiphaga sp.]|uniref:MdtA/MuxA family multidrug efflux RND transporter periplasmic adaptor subunit n=1 Tax=Pigmentiphaga sp. TaxID=1977564 RepID=UPI00128C935E|nr:MdtA/MuxA family multidrug efflux RND transporter periplasmic adaptor subunit [Pigmentiphaga sp.]MPS25331.1 MdtA/MuxA family multidrug efflux RND transporter periplasmic adaptor subunit [Alcaligenaceae bacterium SAGV5]MPS53945.1 MdtA/MuxA family multidrug efflux RND transporter periplasmic adaptor subunit [Alcaligenaceae bacterium SAGV3]MPT59057.1 MdtA/MuxA family multidrug efflux RND transporter periplasmic adaptor subunit [Alcaligenaceae bacterium]
MADIPPQPARAPSSSTSNGKKKQRWLWLAVVVALAGGGYWWWHARQQAAPDAGKPGAGAPRGPGGPGGPGGFQAATPVRVSPARAEDMKVYLKALGTVTAYNTATVRSKVDGELQKIFFQEGQLVKAGDLLVQIDPRPYQVALAQAQGTLEQNRAQLDNARRDLERYQTLYAQDSIARQQVDTQAALVRQYEGTLKTNQAAVDNAKLQLDYTRVTAPIAGRLGLRQVDLGNLVRSSDTNGLVIITQTQPISLLFTIAEGDLPDVLTQLRAGKTLAVQAYDRADVRHLADGVLTTVDNQIDTTTGTVKLKARFENKDESLFPNQFVNTRLHVRTLAGATIIPTGAVQRGSPGTFVYVVNDDNTVSLRVIKLGPSDGERVSVQEGLKPGDRIVVEGVDRLRDGAQVQVVTGSETVPEAAGSQLQRGASQGARRRGNGRAAP